MNKKRVDALRFKSGPTESGDVKPPPPPPTPVGGDVFISDKLGVLLSAFWPLIAIMIIFLSYLFYSRKHKIIEFLWRFK